MRLDTAMALRSGYAGPTYADLHSLFLGMNVTGLRVPRALLGWRDWLRCFDGVQMNEDEFGLLGAATGDPWHLAAEVLGPALKVITVTLGPRGAAYVACGTFDASSATWQDRRALETRESARSGMVAREGAPLVGDPTGCGDVWGATFFSRLLAGDDLEAAMREANRLASRNVEHRGARGLFRHLGGRLSHSEE